MKEVPKILAYSFTENEYSLLKSTLTPLGVNIKLLNQDSLKEKIGYLLGARGYKPSSNISSIEPFPHKVLLFNNLKGKGLKKVLDTLNNSILGDIKYKAIITPYNILWTLEYLCNHIKREHG